MKREVLEAQHKEHSNGVFPNLHRLSPQRRVGHASTDKADALPPPPRGTDGASIEVARRPRGRPPGSRNKPKAAVPIVVAPAVSEPSMCPYVLEIPAGGDVIESAVNFCRRRNIGLCVLNGNGVVSSVTLRQPSAASALAFQGRFDILSISATILPAGGPSPADGSFAIFLAGPQGQVVGGNAVGPLVAAGTVYLIAATFESPSVFRLPTADGEDPAARDDRHESPKAVSGGDGGGVPAYSYHPPDVIWPPTGRQPPPY
ncbi:AT-hook motif nuclear-localized protein 28-like [Andrographis paniculata]|uniref:AT-hook motif nuclear-localized protein 28-like n=1 Tax=Andrographis paniculata TaxID=175694 RepID=UPI0021E866EA|nr:AT-hook motif nuclear-localized protein 28-like [Andrographis paniculata]XP_051118056.1 AT-hook motif nuclear-localized protein 28-like [Andrographis paniculata]XP_051118057.1 AT-hook motif nuclear-localized protein 28-like [Andrographis paniculata]XP_051118058.1 AT-hook motif nuclear-localized protein 28-like [Andrographis paniculata]